MQIEITILNWEKYNPKRDQKTYTWFKLQNDLPFSVSIEQLNFRQRWLFICLLCEASRRNMPNFTTTLQILSRFCSIRGDLCKNDVKVLQEASMILVTYINSAAARCRNTTPRIDKNRIEYIDQSTAKAVDMIKFDFDSIYKRYPRKIGKKKGQQIFKSCIKSEEDFQKLSKSTDNYNYYILKNKIEIKFVKHFDTFMRNWEDWLDLPDGNTSIIQPVLSFD